MRIGIDISVLQTAHRKRGIGYTLINFVNNLPTEAKHEHSFVFYMYPEQAEHKSPLELLQLEDLNYETVIIHPIHTSHFAFPGKLRILNKAINHLRHRYMVRRGDMRIANVDELDWFLQFNQEQPLPNGVKTGLVVYDLIQYIIEPEYLWKYRTARHRGHSRKSAFRYYVKRKGYIANVRYNAKKATKLFAISKHTKDDCVRHLDVDPAKVVVSLLGVTDLEKKPVQTVEGFKKYTYTSWGYFPQKISLKNEKFLLFVGGADPRRRLADLVAAFNNLRAQGEDVKLVMAGDTMMGAYNVPNIELQQYFQHTSYLDDIYFLGFVTDTQKDWLYENAAAFVYPSIYEGFGLPILEAMQYGTPVITYKNSSIQEIAGDAALYARDFHSIATHAKDLLDHPEKRKDFEARGIAQAAKFPWQKTVKTILRSLD